MNDSHNPQSFEPEDFGGPDGFRLLSRTEAAVLTDPLSARTQAGVALREYLNPELFNEGVALWQRVTSSRFHEGFTYRTQAPELQGDAPPSNGCPDLAAMTYPEFVATLLKDGDELLASITPEKLEVWHLATLLAGEAGELLDAIKKHVIYNRELDLENVFEELGDIGFAFQGFLDFFGFTRGEVEAGNRAKLLKRFPKGYTDAAAQRRADKDPEACAKCNEAAPCDCGFLHSPNAQP